MQAFEELTGCVAFLAQLPSGQPPRHPQHCAWVGAEVILWLAHIHRC